MPDLRGRHLTHIGDLETSEIDAILDLAERILLGGPGRPLAQGKVLATLFFEPSTRTRLSFEAAMARLGGSTITVSHPAHSSVTKGETLSDTIRTVAEFADALVLRHPMEGAARLASRVSKVPVINGGDGAGQHPTQTLVDLFTIRKEKGRIGGNVVLICGDLKYGRTVHSLVHALARYGCEMIFVSPPTLGLSLEVRRTIEELGGKATYADRLDEAIERADVLYVTRIQRERFPDPEEYEKVQGTYRITVDLLSRGKKSLIVLHPLPRVGEIDPEVDSTPNAKYFEQASFGVPVRMSILCHLMDLGGLP